MAKAKNSGDVRVRLLYDCAHGRCNDVVTLPAAEAESAIADGSADADPAAVAYAESLAAAACR